jgi:hypothetical protein
VIVTLAVNFVEFVLFWTRAGNISNRKYRHGGGATRTFPTMTTGIGKSCALLKHNKTTIVVYLQKSGFRRQIISHYMANGLSTFVALMQANHFYT